MWSGSIRQTWYSYTILEPCVARLCYSCNWLEVLVHLSFPHNPEGSASSGFEEVGAGSEEAVEGNALYSAGLRCFGCYIISFDRTPVVCFVVMRTIERERPCQRSAISTIPLISDLIAICLMGYSKRDLTLFFSLHQTPLQLFEGDHWSLQIVSSSTATRKLLGHGVQLT